MKHLTIMSADDHLQEPPDLWQKRVPAALRDQAPKMVKLQDGTDAWAWGDNPPIIFGRDVAAGRRFEDYKTAVSWEEVRPAFYEPKARMQDMDSDGITASVLYPNFSRAFIGISRTLVGAWKGTSTVDGDLLFACIRAYNDHLSDFCAVNPKRLVGAAILPLDDVEHAVQEIRRVAKLPGIRGAVIPIEPFGGVQWNDLRFEPLWATAQDVGLPLSMHIGAKKGTPPGPGATEAVMTIAKMSTAESLAFILWAGVFDRYPACKLVSVESGIGWLGYFRERAENVYRRHRFSLKSSLKHPPGDYFGRNIFATFEEERSGILTKDLIGVDALLWASDYPHTDTTWPKSRDVIEKYLVGVPEDEVRKLVHLNTARVYGLN